MEAGKTVKKFAAQAGQKTFAEPMRKPIAKREGKVDITTMVEKPKPQAVTEEAHNGYELMIIGLDKPVERKNQFHDDITKLTTGFEGPLAVVDARDLHREACCPALSILVPVNGTAVARRGAEVAITLARATKAPLTALYVSPGGKKCAAIRGGDPQGDRGTRGDLRRHAAHRGPRRYCA